MGTSPVQFDVPIGKHSIFVTMPGFETAELPVDVPARTTSTLHPALPLPYAALWSFSPTCAKHQVSGPYVYWTNKVGGAVMRVLKVGGTAEILASDQGAPAGIAVDTIAIYWANRDSGTVMRLAR